MPVYVDDIDEATMQKHPGKDGWPFWWGYTVMRQPALITTSGGILRIVISGQQVNKYDKPPVLLKKDEIPLEIHNYLY